jgi:small subunit ribosomal protein S21
MQAHECKPAIAAPNERRSFPTTSSATSWRAPTIRFLSLRICAIRSAGAPHALLTHEGNISCRYWFATTTSTRRFGCSRRRCAREQNEALRRARKLARKKAQREGLLPAPRGKKLLAGKPPGRGGPFSGAGGPPRQT